MLVRHHPRYLLKFTSGLKLSGHSVDIDPNDAVKLSVSTLKLNILLSLSQKIVSKKSVVHFPSGNYFKKFKLMIPDDFYTNFQKSHCSTFIV